MPRIIIIESTPGLTTTERVLTLIQQSPEGISVKDISQKLNRSVSMVLRCLKLLMAERQIHAQMSESGMHLLYYPGCKPRRRRDVA